LLNAFEKKSTGRFNQKRKKVKNAEVSNCRTIFMKIAFIHHRGMSPRLVKQFHPYQSIYNIGAEHRQQLFISLSLISVMCVNLCKHAA